MNQYLQHAKPIITHGNIALDDTSYYTGLELVSAIFHQLNTMHKGLTEQQEIDASFIREILRVDKEHPPTDRNAPWNRYELELILKAMDRLFFNGQIGVERHKVALVQDPALLDKLDAAGATYQMAGPGRKLMIKVWTALQSSYYTTRLQSRSRVLTALAHECLHAFFERYICNCNVCGPLNAQYYFDMNKHGRYWMDSAHHLTREFLNHFEDLLEEPAAEPEHILSIRKDPFMMSNVGANFSDS